MPQRKNNRHMGGEELLHKATGGWRYKTDNKLRGAFAETDFAKKTIRLNKKKHKAKRSFSGERKNPDGTESLLNTIVHEREHVRDPKATEKQVRKRARLKLKKMSTRQKQKAYRLFDK